MLVSVLLLQAFLCFTEAAGYTQCENKTCLVLPSAYVDLRLYSGNASDREAVYLLDNPELTADQLAEMEASFQFAKSGSWPFPPTCECGPWAKLNKIKPLSNKKGHDFGDRGLCGAVYDDYWCDHERYFNRKNPTSCSVEGEIRFKDYFEPEQSRRYSGYFYAKKNGQYQFKCMTAGGSCSIQLGKTVVVENYRSKDPSFFKQTCPSQPIYLEKGYYKLAVNWGTPPNTYNKLRFEFRGPSQKQGSPYRWESQLKQGNFFAGKDCVNSCKRRSYGKSRKGRRHRQVHVAHD